MGRGGTDDGTLIFGCGYVGQRVAERLRNADPSEAVYTVTRSQQKADRLARLGCEPIIADWTDRRSLAGLPNVARVLVAVSYDRRSRLSRDDSQVGGLGNLLDFVAADCDLIYLSSTGVFHQTDGRWVDEATPARPRAAGGQAHLRGEELLWRRRPTAAWVVLRLAGIYGPGRIPRINDVVAERPIDGPNGGFLNLIHLEDAAAAILAAWRQPQRSRLYLVSDDRPVIRRDFYRAIASLVGAPSPQFVSQNRDSLSSRSASNKRVWNRRLRHQLLPQMTFPDYFRGLTAILK